MRTWKLDHEPIHCPRHFADLIPFALQKVEVAVKQIISGRDVEASATVANPGCLEGFKRFRGVEREGGDAKL